MNKTDNIVLNECQKDAFKKICSFINGKSAKVFILKGFAGTGKTTIIRTVVNYMEKRSINYSLMASTGRAAKILSNISGCDAKTVHNEIYGYSRLNVDTDKIKETEEEKFIEGLQLKIIFDLKEPPFDVDVYIVDEASMISDAPEKDAAQSCFGSGKLLTDLMMYNSDAKFIFVGDPCQLPPISGELSPALSTDYLAEHFGAESEEFTLTEIMRQEEDNDLIDVASRVRFLWEDAPIDERIYGDLRKWERLPFRGNYNLKLLSSTEELATRYIRDIKGNHYSNAVFICKNNANCYSYNVKFREMLGFRGGVKVGELLLVIQNNQISGLRNGDMVIIKSISPLTEERAGLVFREIEVEDIYTGRIIKQLMIESLLYQPNVNLNSEQQTRLFVDFIIRMKKKGISDKKNNIKFQEMMSHDLYLNALRLSFGYALTCHKSQGGEWKNVYACFPRNIMLNPTKQKYQWVYTAMTRAREKFFVVDDIYIEGYRKWI